ncbi:MAG: 50S ribosomal protein L9 [Oscillospiraceae bacterium]|jgi:large subunit ribosomal protein L9|nr:50S ribosomal protein L9 [Oscillospiraceae bacterium]
MKVILLSDVNGLGKADDIVDVNDGYARNFLIKRKMALEATVSNLNSIRLKKGSQAEKARKEKEEAQSVASKLAGQKVVLEMKAGEGGKLYGAVTSADVAEALGKLGFSADKKNISIKGPIKSAGEYEATVKLHSEVSVNVTVEVKTFG